MGGFAGPGDVYFDGDLDTSDIFHVTEDDEGILQLSGMFERDDGMTLPASTAIFSDLVDDDAGTFVQAQGDMDPSTGEFTVTVSDVPLGFNNVILSFAVLDPADTPDEQGADTVFSLDVVNDGCSSPLTITLVWSTIGLYSELEITEPGGSAIYTGQTGVSKRKWHVAGIAGMIDFVGAWETLEIVCCPPWRGLPHASTISQQAVNL